MGRAGWGIEEDRLGRDLVEIGERPDTISEFGSSDIDTLRLEGVAPADVQLAWSGGDLDVHIGDEAVRVYYQHNGLGYGVERIRPKAKEQAQVILRSAEKLNEAVERLEGFKDSASQLHALRDLEDEGDRLNRAAVSELFSSEEDPIAVIRWKDIHEQLEEAVDACENAADVLEAILVKNR